MGKIAILDGPAHPRRWNVKPSSTRVLSRGAHLLSLGKVGTQSRGKEEVEYPVGQDAYDAEQSGFAADGVASARLTRCHCLGDYLGRGVSGQARSRRPSRGQSMPLGRGDFAQSGPMGLMGRSLARCGIAGCVCPPQSRRLKSSAQAVQLTILEQFPKSLLCEVLVVANLYPGWLVRSICTRSKCELGRFKALLGGCSQIGALAVCQPVRLLRSLDVRERRSAGF